MFVQFGALVMVVDEDLEVRRAICGALEADGYDVLTVASGEAALARIGMGAKPAIVIIGLGLPGMGSKELARRLRSCSRYRVPLIVLTAPRVQARQRRSCSLSLRMTAARRTVRRRALLPDVVRLGPAR